MERLLREFSDAADRHVGRKELLKA